MNHEQLVINNLGLKIASSEVEIADLKAKLDIANEELKQSNITIENLKKEIDSLRNSSIDEDGGNNNG